MIRSHLVDARNIGDLYDQIISEISIPELVGLDIETHDDDRHEGLNELMKVDEDGFKAGSTRLFFDVNRTTVVGLSIYPDNGENIYYFNINHADVQHRIPWRVVESILKRKREDARWVIHNAAFERVMLMKSVGFEVTNYICTMYLCASAYNPDEYNPGDLLTTDFPEMEDVIRRSRMVFADFNPAERKMSTEQIELLNQIVSKESKAKQSWNGIVDKISFGYDLKSAVKTWFGYQMTTYKEVTAGYPHMGAMTGPQTFAYGCDDSYWCVKLFHRVSEYMMEKNPKSFLAFMKQELPCIEVYADIQMDGWRLNRDAIYRRQQEEVAILADSLRKLRSLLRSFLPFDAEPNAEMKKRDKTYAKKYQNKRAQIIAWLLLSDSDDDNIEVARISSAVSVALGFGRKGKINIVYWESIRCILYDLLQEKPILVKGEVAADVPARGVLISKLLARKQKGEDVQRKIDVVTLLSELASIEQRHSLYINPYLNLIDPDTGRVYPIVMALLATHRTSMNSPNGQQLAKNGGSVYIRDFYLPDDDEEEVLVSIDWKSIELVGVAEFSQGSAMKEIFGVLPYRDMHSKTAAACLRVWEPALSEDLFKNISHLTSGEIKDLNPRIFLDVAGIPMLPDAAKKYWRKEVGKVANFNYWYSGFLSSIGDKLGWTLEETAEATELYRQQYPEEEAWRVGLIEQAKHQGFIELPDGHRRYRFEATSTFNAYMHHRFDPIANTPGVNNSGVNFLNEVIRRIQKRANNQVVNSMIQGHCASLLKRTMLQMREFSRDTGWFRIKAPIHDELVNSVKVKHILEFIKQTRQIFNNHPDLFPTIPLDCSISIGHSFVPFHPVKYPLGQIEIDEAPELDWIPKQHWGKALPDDEILRVVHYLKTKQKEMA